MAQIIRPIRPPCSSRHTTTKLPPQAHTSNPLSLMLMIFALDLPSALFPLYAHTGRVPPPTLPSERVLIHNETFVARMTHISRTTRTAQLVR